MKSTHADIDRSGREGNHKMLFLVAMFIASLNGVFIPWYLWPFVASFTFICWLIRTIVEFGCDDMQNDAEDE